MKAIETEYKNQISLEIPDLWSRIEAGVDQYEMSKESTKSSEVISEAKVIASQENAADEKIVNINRSKKIIPILGRIAVAAACIALASTVVMNFGNRKDESASSTMNFAADSAPAAETDMAETTQMEAEEACEEAAEAMMDESNADYSAEPDMAKENAGSMEKSEEAKSADSDATEAAAETTENRAYDNDSILDITTILDGDIYSAIDVADQMVAGGIPNIKAVSLEEPVEIENHWLMRVEDREANVYLVTVIHENDEMFVTKIQKDNKSGEIVFESERK